LAFIEKFSTVHPENQNADFADYAADFTKKSAPSSKSAQSALKKKDLP
jgi:hypothetical protein